MTASNPEVRQADAAARFASFAAFLRDPQSIAALEEVYGLDWRRAIVGLTVEEVLHDVYRAGARQIEAALDRLEADRRDQRRKGEPPAVISEQFMNLQALIDEGAERDAREHAREHDVPVYPLSDSETPDDAARARSTP